MTSLPDTTLQSAPALEAIRIIDVLRNAGFQAVLAGGCVRDALIGRTPKDFDVATDATPDSVREVFGKRNTLAFGSSFGVIGVLPPKSVATVQEKKQLPTEVATFRADGNYSDGRRPDTVTFGTAEADALRRDFTINGMFYDTHLKKVLDYVGGLDDLRAKHLKTIGDAARRFDEDKLRMLRAVRFVTTFGLTVESTTFSAIQQHADSIRLVSGERIGAEMRRIVVQNGGDHGLRLLVETGLHRHVWAALDVMPWSVLSSRYERLSSHEFVVVIAVALLTMHASPAQAANDLKRLASNWKLSVAEQRAISAGIENAQRLIDCELIAWSQLQPMLIDRDIATTLEAAEVICADGNDRGVRRARYELVRDDRPLDPPPLLSGNDLIGNGFVAGPQFKSWLMGLRQKQLDGELTTEAEALHWVASRASAS